MIFECLFICHMCIYSGLEIEAKIRVVINVLI